MILARSPFFSGEFRTLNAESGQKILFFKLTKRSSKDGLWKENFMNYEIRNLSKEFGSKKAVRNLSVSLKPGLYGLLGANGAGKTTLMRMLAGVSKPTRGEIFIDGNPVTSPTQLSGRVGYLPQDMGYYPEMNAKEFLSFMAAVKGIPEEDAEVKISQLIRQVNLQEKA